MNAASLAIFQRANIALGLLAIIVGAVIWGRTGLVAAAAGAALGWGNLWVIRRLADRAARLVAKDAGAAPFGALMTGLMLKTAMLAALVGLAVWGLGLAVAPFALGLSALTISVVVCGLRLGLSEAA